MRRWDAFPAERTIRLRIRRDIESPESVDGDVQPRGTARSVDEDGRTGDRSARRPDGLDRLLDGPPCGHDVVDDEHPLARRDREPTAELAAGCAFAPFGVDRAHDELPRHLVSEDDPACRRSGDGLHGQRRGPRRDRGAQPLVRRGLQDWTSQSRGVFARAR